MPEPKTRRFTSIEVTNGDFVLRCLPSASILIDRGLATYLESGGKSKPSITVRQLDDFITALVAMKKEIGR